MSSIHQPGANGHHDTASGRVVVAQACNASANAVVDAGWVFSGSLPDACPEAAGPGAAPADRRGRCATRSDAPDSDGTAASIAV